MACRLVAHSRCLPLLSVRCMGCECVVCSAGFVLDGRIFSDQNKLFWSVTKPSLWIRQPLLLTKTTCFGSSISLFRRQRFCRCALPFRHSRRFLKPFTLNSCRSACYVFVKGLCGVVDVLFLFSWICRSTFGRLPKQESSCCKYQHLRCETHNIR